MKNRMRQCILLKYICIRAEMTLFDSWGELDQMIVSELWHTQQVESNIQILHHTQSDGVANFRTCNMK